VSDLSLLPGAADGWRGERKNDDNTLPGSYEFATGRNPHGAVGICAHGPQGEGRSTTALPKCKSLSRTSTFDGLTTNRNILEAEKSTKSWHSAAYRYVGDYCRGRQMLLLFEID
jgi:hypothetical protein